MARRRVPIPDGLSHSIPLAPSGYLLFRVLSSYWGPDICGSIYRGRCSTDTASKGTARARDLVVCQKNDIDTIHRIEDEEKEKKTKKMKI